MVRACSSQKHGSASSPCASPDASPSSFPHLLPVNPPWARTQSLDVQKCLVQTTAALETDGLDKTEDYTFADETNAYQKKTLGSKTLRSKNYQTKALIEVSQDEIQYSGCASRPLGYAIRCLCRLALAYNTLGSDSLMR